MLPRTPVPLSEMWKLNAMVLCAAISGTLFSPVKTLSEVSFEDTINSLKQRMTDMEDRLLTLEGKYRKTLEQKKDLSERLLVVEMALTRERNKIEKLEIKENLTRSVVLDVEKDIRNNMASSAENLWMHINETFLRFENVQSNITKKMRTLENSLENDYANASYVSKLDESVQNFEKNIEARLQSIQAELYPRVKQLEERRDLHDDVAEIENTLRNHSSKISALNRQLFNIQESCAGEPPSLLNGKPMDFERKEGSNVRYRCDRDFVMTGNSTVLCKSSEWEGHPPTCNYFDGSFSAVARRDTITCFSEENANEIAFSSETDTGSDGSLPKNTIRKTSNNSTQISFAAVKFKDRFGIYRCGFNGVGRKMDIFIPSQFYGYLYFLDPFQVANTGDTVELQLHSTLNYAIRWKHNGMIIESWNNKNIVKLSNVQPSDTGIYECYYEEDKPQDSLSTAFLRLIVRKCKANLYGEHCNQTCPPCYNGGICHDHLGICVCPQGFVGNNCERACPKGFYGSNCSTECSNGDCRNLLHCKPDPYGCSCAPGFKGIWCEETCEPGWYGANCKQPCHCLKGSDSCNLFNGACSEGCTPGWTGDSCQIEVLG